MFRKYIEIVRNIDDPAGGGGDPAPDPVVAAGDPDPVGDPAPDPQPDPAARPDPGKKPWYLERISQESAKANEAAAKLAAAERRAADAEALAERLRAGRNDPPANDPPANQRQAPDTDRQAEVRREAAAMRLYEDSLDVRNRGVAEFGPKFSETLSILNAVGATSDDFISDVLAVDKTNAHVLLNTIAADPERANSLASMNSRQRIAELTRMSVAATPAKAPAAAAVALSVVPKADPKNVSKAPAPAPRIQPSASQVVDGYADDASDEQFTAQFNARMKERAGRR